jgi:hypothetical protein
MDSINKYTSQPLVVGIIGLVVGTLFGLVVLGWWLFPVQWTDASPADLTHEYQVDYMRMSIDSFAVNGDAALAQSRYNALGEDANQVYLEIVAPLYCLSYVSSGLYFLQEPREPTSITPAGCRVWKRWIPCRIWLLLLTPYLNRKHRSHP